MYAPGIPWQVLDVSTLAQPSQCLSHWLCALQQRDSPAGGWAQGRLRSAGGQVLPPELRKEHSLSWAQRKTKPNHTKTRAEPVADKSRTGKGDIGRGLSRGCFALRAGSASPVPSPPAACCVSVQRTLSVCWGRECQGQGLLLPALQGTVVPVHGSLGTVKFSNTRMGWAGRAVLWSGLLGNVPPWRNGTPTFSTWAREAPALLNPPLLPISSGLRGQLLQPDGLPVPPEAVWEAARRG